jgi:hypothetical protein
MAPVTASEAGIKLKLETLNHILIYIYYLRVLTEFPVYGGIVA